MKTYKILGGHITDRQTKETVEEIHGTLTAVDVRDTEKGTRHLYLTLEDGENQSELRVRLYGDLALKILRCLYGVVSCIAEAAVGIFIEERDGEPNLVHITHGGRDLMPLGSVPTYGDLRDMMVQRLYGILKSAIDSRFPVAVVSLRRDGQPVVLDEPAVGEVARMMQEAVREGRVDDVMYRKHVFSSPATVAAFLDGARTMGRGFVFVTDDPGSIALLDEAAATATPTEPGEDIDPEDNEEV